MKKIILKAALFSVAGVGLMAGSAMATPISWVVSPYSPTGGTTVFGETNVVGLQEINNSESGTQLEGIYGAGFITAANAIVFDADLYTWDSYSLEGDQSDDGGYKGWWDAFVVNINQTGFYWDIVNGGSGTIVDPMVDSSYQGGSPVFDNSVLPGATWVFGGEDYGNGTLESFNNTPTEYITLSMLGGDPNLPYYVSVVLDTATDPYHDESYSSWGSFHVQPVPEPATMLLFGTGLAGLAGISRRRTKKA